MSPNELHVTWAPLAAYCWLYEGSVVLPCQSQHRVKPHDTVINVYLFTTTKALQFLKLQNQRISKKKKCST